MMNRGSRFVINLKGHDESGFTICHKSGKAMMNRGSRFVINLERPSKGRGHRSTD